MYKFIILILIYLLGILRIYGYDNFLPGYVININNDTIKGLIDYKNWSINPDFIQFRNANSIEFIFYPKDIKEFYVSGELYLSAFVKIDNNGTNLTTLNYAPKKTKITPPLKNVFLLVCFLGEKNLYYYKNIHEKGNMYIKNDDDDYMLLIYQRYIEDRKEGTVIITDRKYIGQLIYYFQDCPEIKNKIEISKYSIANISELFKVYYKIKGLQPKYELRIINQDNKTQNNESSKFSGGGVDTGFVKVNSKKEIGVISGLSITKLNIQFSSSILDEFDFPVSPNFTGGVFLDLYLPEYRWKWSINNELTYTSYKVNYQQGQIKATIGYSFLNLNNMFRYHFPEPKKNIFINFGISNSLVLSDHSKFEPPEIGYELYDIRKLELGFLFGVGAHFNKLMFEVRINRGNGMSNLLHFKAITYKGFFIVGYQF